jgi:hypothetical protein
LQLGDIALEFFILSLKVVDVSLLRGAEAALDEINSILRLLRLLIETHKHLGQLVNDACLLEELAELLLLLFSCLSTHY